MKMVPVLLAIAFAGSCSAPPPDADDGASAAASAPGPAPDASVLMEADRAFAAAVAGGGSEAWASWFAEDGAMIQPRVGEIRGREDIRDYVTWLDDPQVSLRWEPSRADIAASGDLGWTTGQYVSEGVDDNGQPTRGEGRYVSIWRRAADGSWKVVMDLGNPTAPRPAAQ